jgi:glyoxylase-like metal-dependent hydrolase (beta-lactamase superfamily II)
MNRAALVLLAFFLVGPPPALADGPAAELPVRLSRVSERVVAARVGDVAWSNQSIAVASQQGIVVIDAFSSWAYQERIRAALEKEFGRSDFFAVINTHQHFDHTNGNQIYARLPIIAHQAAREGLLADPAGIQAWSARLERGVLGMEKKRATLDPKSREGLTNAENLAYWQAVLRDMQQGHRITPPNVTFSDRMSIHLGDVTLDLYSFPGLHSKGDILVHIREEGVLCVGDMINDGWLPPLDAESATDVAYLLRAWKDVLDRGQDIRHVLPGHSYVKVSFESFKWRYGYFKALWDGLSEAKHEGKSLAEVQTMFAFETAFPDQKDMIRKLPGGAEGGEIDVHARNIEILWAALRK